MWKTRPETIGTSLAVHGSGITGPEKNRFGPSFEDLYEILNDSLNHHIFEAEQVQNGLATP